MSFSLLDILPVALIAVFLYKSKIVPKAQGINGDYLSIQTSISLRGILAIVVVFHHLAQKTTSGMLFAPFTRYGFLAVSAFMFLSGYGLQKSHMRSENYKRKFLLKRIPQVLFPYIIVIALFWLMYAFDGKIYSFNDIAQTFVKGDPIAAYSWYIINILVFYVAYWLLMLMFRKRYLAMIIGAVVWYGLYAAFCYKMGYPAYWYSSSNLVIIGMIWATYEDKILYFVKKRYIPVTIISFVLFISLFIVKINFEITLSRPIPLLLTMIVSILFVLCVIMYSLKVKFGNRILEFLGKCSLEIYLVQGLFIIGLRGNRVFIDNEFLWAILTVAGSVALGFVLHVAFSKILRGYRKLLRLDK